MLIIGLSSTQLLTEEKHWITSPEVSGVILFTRNFKNISQLNNLIEEIRELRADPFLLCVDQEGGPVQRFREGFTSLPALARLGELYDKNPKEGIARTEEHAWLMASEIRAMDIDLSFAPVLDLRRGNRAIGERAFHADPAVVAELGTAYMRGMRLAGMASTIKHFPGHGSVLEDTHFDVAIDSRSVEEIRILDLPPFVDAIKAGADAVMMAHVVYPQVDKEPAGYSEIWIKKILREELGFKGVVFSDDIGMAAAFSVGGVGERIHRHLDAGCDLVLVCSPDLVSEAINSIRGRTPCDPRFLEKLQGKLACTWENLQDNPQRNLFIEKALSLNNLRS